MRLLSPRLLVPVAVVVVVWAGAHLLTSHDASVVPSVWPMAAPTASPSSGAAPLSQAIATAAPSPSATAAGIPILPGALRQLNGSTRDTAVGLYALVQQLEATMRWQLEQLVGQLEPGR